MTDEAEAVLEAALEPHEPAAEEIEARRRVRDRATGMTHHKARAALEAVLAAAGDLETVDPAVRAGAAEWQRIADLLLDHGGPYTPDTDAYVQGQLTARHHHRDRPRPPAPSPPSG
ncbi:hypothetical protein [Streptomyces roseus]|uniref:Uncharacterized protein n=1 Tax=Streptomyces roseus TaxID=66430 RepID=A0A0J6XPE4_9ACTN|nr:hypothetical protein [Streptomyces roseus]KMO96618.1 hypothetical protein ACS04_17180 [Streptomyces roseus]